MIKSKLVKSLNVSLIALTASLNSDFGYAQQIETMPANELSCLYSSSRLDTEIFAFAPEERAERIVDTIVEVSGLQKNFKLVSGNVPNICAKTTENNDRYIIYSSAWLNRLTQEVQPNNWPLIVAFAHEVGHHLNNDTFQPGGNKRRREVAADYFAGVIVGRLGGTLDQASRMFDIIARENTVASIGSHSYPPVSARIEALRAGWNSAQPSTSGDVTPTAILPNPAPEDLTEEVALATNPITGSELAGCRLEVVPATFRSVAQTVVVEEASQALRVVPATYKSVTDRVLAAEEHYAGDAMIDTTETIVTRDATQQLQVVPATYKTVSETVVVEPAYENLQVTEDGQSVRRVAIPAKTRTISRRIVDRPASARRVQVPAQTETVNVKRVGRSTNSGQLIPAQYNTITKRIIDSPSSVQRVAVPGKTATLTTRVLASPPSVRRACP